MKAIGFLMAVVLVCLAVAVAGCTGSTSGAQTGSGSSSASSGSSSSGLTTSPTDAMPANIAVTVTVDEKDYLGKIPVTFDGGQGQVNVKSITCTLTRADGTTQTTTLGSNKGDQVKLDGTRGSGSLTGQADRVQVSVTMNNGQTYKIADVLREYRTRG
jgi:hypothetical protein